MAAGVSIDYDYGPVPTCREFALSNAAIRGLMGPFGCTSGDTQYLSPAGWRRIDEYDGGSIGTWSAQTGRVEFERPLDHIVAPATDLIEFDSGSLVMRLSAEHRVPHWDWAGRFVVKTASEIERRPSRRTIPTTFEGPARSTLGWSDDMIRYAVMMHADGHFPKVGRRAILTLRKERKKDRARALLDRLGIPYRERAYPRRPTETTFTFEPPYKGKRYTGSWWQASQHELAVVLDEMRHWDGHDGEILIFSSAHREDAEFIQYAAHANGLRASCVEVNPSALAKERNWKPHWRVNVRRGDNHKNRACIREETNIQRVPALNGAQYCFTTSTGFWLARCDGTIFITGNSGKSSACVTELIRRGQMTPRGPDGVRHSRFAVVRNTYQQLRDTTIRTVMQWLPHAYFGRYVEQKHSYRITTFPGADIELLFLALDRPDDVSKLLSLELTGAWLNEAREIPWSIVEAIQGRIGRFPRLQDVGPYWHGVWMDTNAPDTDSSWYRFFEERGWLKDFRRLQESGVFPKSMQPEEYAAIFKQPSGLGPDAENLGNLQPGYYQKLAVGKSTEWVKVYVDGQYGFVVEGKLVYPEYRDELHCRAVEPMDGVGVIRSWDYGLAPACLFSQMLPTGQWLTFDEMTSDNMSIDQFSDEVLHHCQRAFRGQVTFEDWGDPAGEGRVQTDKRSCFDIQQAKGIDIQKSEQEPRIRQESVRYPLRNLVGGEPMFIIHPRCKVTRKGFMGGYHRRRLSVPGPERYAVDPEKNLYSHPHDALQYGMAKYFAPTLRGENMEDEDWPNASSAVEDRATSSATGY